MEKGFYLSRAYYSDEILLTWREYSYKIQKVKHLFHLGICTKSYVSLKHKMCNRQVITGYRVYIQSKMKIASK
jgi:hypothetical protein